MGKGYVVGLLVGALFSSVSVAALSLILPPATAPAVPEPEAAATVPEAAPVEEPVAEAPSAEAPVAAESVAEAPVAVPAKPVIEAAPEPAPEEAAAAPGAPAAPAPEIVTKAEPETPVVEVPAGSEFNRPKPEEDPLVPAPQPAPAASGAPAVSLPEPEEQPVLTERNPAAVPEGQTEAPAALAEPAAAAPAAIAEAPAGEAAVPVPPPGTAVVPDLSPGLPETDIASAEDRALQDAPDDPVAGAEPDAGMAPVEDSAPEASENDPAADAESAPAPSSRLPQILAEEPPAGEPAPLPVAEAETAPGLTPAPSPRILTPGTRLPASDGPVIIDLAPAPPVGATGRPQVGFRDKATGVQINRLPRIGVAEPAADPAAEAVPAVDTAVTRYRAAFDNPEGKPVLAIILVGDGSAASVAPDAVAEIGAPVTIALNPEETGVATLAQSYRLAGEEVAIYAPAMPEGATPSDLEVSYQGYVQTLPEAVAIVAAPDSALQSDRGVAQHIASLLVPEGRALVTHSRGLNPARQAAARAGAPYAGITRSLDEAGQDEAEMQRLLDRAAFDAARSGGVLLIGRATPVTVAALKTWIDAGGKEAVIGPLSAILAP